MDNYITQQIKSNREKLKLITIGVILNCLGRFFAVAFNIPGLANVLGTILVAYFAGAIPSIITVIISYNINAIFMHSDLFYIYCDIILAYVVARLSKENRYITRFLSVFSMTITHSFVRALCFMGVDMWIYDGRTGLALPDAVIDFLHSMGISLLIQYFVGAFYVCFADVTGAMFILYFGLKSYRFIKKKMKAKRLKKALGGKATLGLIALTFGLSFFDAMTVDAAGINFVQRQYSTESGLIGGCANDIVQTSDGSMWVATYGGLYRFNGSKFELLTNIDSVRSVECLYVDNEDRLCVGTNGAGVTFFQPDVSHIVLNMDNGLPSNTIRAVKKDTSGYYYIATTGGVSIAHINDTGVHVDKNFTGLGSISSVDVDHEGRAAAINSLGKISIFKAREIIQNIDIKDDTAHSIDFNQNGDLYVGTDNGKIYIYSLVNENFELKETIDVSVFEGINDLYFEDDGSIFIAANNGIGYVSADGDCRMINSGEFDNSVFHIYKDYQGNIWFTSSRNGLCALSTASFIDIFGICNVPQKVVNVDVIRDGLHYIGTDEGLVVLDVYAGCEINNELTEFYADSRVRSIAKTQDDSLIIASYGKTLYEYTKDGQLRPYLNSILSEEDIENKIRFVTCLSDGTVVSSGEKALTFMKEHEVTAKLLLGNELSKSNCLNAIEAKDGSVFVGTDGDGIAVIENGHVKRYVTDKDGLSSGVILRMVSDKEGSGYFVLTGSGLCYMDADFSVRELSGVPFYNNYDLFQMNNGKVFIIGGAGVYIVDYMSLMEGDSADNYTLLNQKAGMPGSLTSNAWNSFDDNGYLNICGNTGVYTLDTNQYMMKVPEYKSKITQVKLDSKAKTITKLEDIVIPRGVKQFELTLELNNFTPTDPRVRYYMTGIDTEKNLVLASELEGISYYMIPYGNYSFHIEVLDENNKIVSSQIYTITKDREVYETTGFRIYFYAILSLIVMFIVTSIVNGFVYTLTRQQEALHEMVVSKLEKEKSEALERALHSEEEANKTKSAFLANMSHEIRTPINAIIGMVTMILRETEQDNIKEYAGDIRNASKTLLALINDILDFSKIESDNLELVLADYDMCELINDVVKMIKPKADSKNLEFEVNINPGIYRYLYGDEVRIEQILLNILNNAVKYTERGKVTFNMDYEVSEADDIYLKVSVIDTGIGIKDEDIDKLFSPYKRIEESRNKKVEGTGLGMSITKNLLEKMGSVLEVSSVYGQGSTFSFMLMQPIKGSEKVEDYTTKVDDKDTDVTNVEKYHAKDAKVLVVDDVEMNLIVATNLLKRIEVEVDTASSGEQAILLSMCKKYDVIMLDSMMPEMNGEEALVKIKGSCILNANTPIIVLTANAVKGAREEYLSKGFDDYLSKPIDGILLEDMLLKYLPKDKVEPYYGKGSAKNIQTEETTDSELLVLSGIEAIDVNAGVEAAGGEEVYKTICRNFFETSSEKLSMIEEYFTNKDVKNYTIQVHALKSSARLIGANTLSKNALDLEQAGRDNNMALIEEKTPKLLSDYKALLDLLEKIYGKVEEEEDNRELISEAELEEAYAALKEFIPAMEYDGVEMVLQQINEYKLSEEDRVFFEKLQLAHKKFDWDEMESLIEN